VIGAAPPVSAAMPGGGQRMACWVPDRRRHDGSGRDGKRRDGKRREDGGGRVVREATRRGVLAAVVSLPLVATGCKGVGALGTPPRQQPDVAVVRDAIDGETLMISRYNAVLAAVPALAGPLGPLLKQHHEHLARLRARLIEPNAASRPGRSPAVTASPAGAQVPGTPAAARAYLRHAEQAAARTLLGKLTAAPPSLAQLLASIAASEATHALVLGPGRAA
jgi:hypothetical protein